MHIISAENMLFGFSFIIMSFYKDLEKVRVTAFIITVLMILRRIVIFYGTLLYNPSGLKNILVDSIAIVIYIAIIILGTRVKNK